MYVYMYVHIHKYIHVYIYAVGHLVELKEEEGEVVVVEEEMMRVMMAAGMPLPTLPVSQVCIYADVCCCIMTYADVC
jgi:hypothetical protein